MNGPAGRAGQSQGNRLLAHGNAKGSDPGMSLAVGSMVPGKNRSCCGCLG